MQSLSRHRGVAGNRQNDAENLGRSAANVVVNYHPPKRDDADEVVRSIETECGTAIAPPI